MGVLDTPLTLLASLGLGPATYEQERFLESFALLPQSIDVEDDENGTMMNAVALAAVWRLVCRGPIIGTVLAPNESVAREFMHWIERLTQQHSEGFQRVTQMPRWNQLRMGQNNEWQLRVMTLNAFGVAARAERSGYGIILRARDEEPEFFEACKALEKGLQKPGSTLIRLW